MKKHLKKHFWDYLSVILGVGGVICGLIGFTYISQANLAAKPPGMAISFQYKLYETIRMFLLNRQFEINEFNCWICVSAGLLLGAFLIFTFRLFLRILAPKAWNLIRIKLYKNHIVLCGLNELSMSFINKCTEERIVVITSNKNNIHLESLRQRGVRIVEGDANDTNILKLANIKHASKAIVLKADDKINIEIAFKIYKELSRSTRKIPNALKCYVLINSMGLKRTLDDSPIFSRMATDSKGKPIFDGILFNISSIGVRYGLNKRIDIVFQNFTAGNPQLLVFGLSEIAGDVIETLAHGLTTDHQHLKFTVVEEDKHRAACFLEKYKYLTEFVEIELITGYYKELDATVRDIENFSSVFFCFDDPVENIKASFSFSRGIRKKHPPVITFCNRQESIGNVLCIRVGNKDSYAEKRNVHIINILSEAFDYVFELDKNIEDCAEIVHERWRKMVGGKDTYNNMSEHFKQSNRNQVLDSCYKMFLVAGYKLENCRTSTVSINLSVEQKNIMSEMEHRRWMIEKYTYGWVDGITRNDHLLIHPDMKKWKDLSHDVRKKDMIFIDLLEEILMNQYMERSYIPKPLDTSGVRLSDNLLALTEELARNTHEVWGRQRISEGWTYGSERNDAAKQHPGIVPYEELSEIEKQYDRNTAMEAIKAITLLGFKIVKI